MNRAITQARLLFQRRPASRFHPAAPNHVSIPDDWNEQEDLEYFQQNMCIEGTDDTLNVVLNDLENFRGVLTFAYCFLTRQPYEPYDSCVFQNLPVRSKVGLLRKLLRKRNLDAKCVATFDCKLRRFVDLDQICMPVLQRWLLDPKSVRLRELTRVSLDITRAVFDFSESMYCELDGCPDFHNVTWITPPCTTA